jgi:dTDP-4-amino-4,6-dideoxygalactose transaminase
MAEFLAESGAQPVLVESSDGGMVVADDLDVAEKWASECVSLPCFPELTDDEVDDVCAALVDTDQ